ncbi:MAG: transcription elongation factor GreA [Patescibacteria group bacterium]
MSQFITPEGLEKLKAELEYLQTVKQQELAERLRRAIAHGDLSENFDYADAKEQQVTLQMKIRELQGKIRDAKIVSATATSGKTQIGSKVLVQSDNQKISFLIVTAQEANPLEGKISVESPLGSALLGKREGAKVKVQVPDGEMEYKILKIDW